jgi:hypothetical protein
MEIDNGIESRIDENEIRVPRVRALRAGPGLGTARRSEEGDRTDGLSHR